MNFSRILKQIKTHSYEYLTAAAILIFILFKLHDLLIPFQWDEMGVYVPAAFKMIDTHHISLLPGSIDPEFSRGHPLLFTFCNAIAFKLFGETVRTGHLFSLFLAVATLVMFFILAKNIFNKKVAFFATFLLAAQPIFFSLSGQLLPEMMLTFFTLGSFYGILKNKWVLYGIFSSLAILTKESAIVIPATALILVLTNSIIRRDFFTLRRWKDFLIAATPLFVFGIFLVVQKVQMGWFLFPEHIGYIHWGWDRLTGDAAGIFQEMFIFQGRFLIGLPFLAGTILVFFLERLDIEPKGRILHTFLLFIFLAFIFADVNYYLTRYILYVIPFILLGGAWTAITILEKLFPKRIVQQWFMIVVLFGSGIILGYKNMHISLDTCDMSYKRIVDVCVPAIHWAEKNWNNDTIEANFPLFQGLGDPRNGYLTGKALHYSVNFEKPVKHGLIFYFTGNEVIPAEKKIKYHILQNFNDRFANVAAIEFEW